jgi:hypothetical protein
MKINCDIQSKIFLEKNPTYHSKMKHIDVQYPFVRDMVESDAKRYNLSPRRVSFIRPPAHRIDFIPSSTEPLQIPSGITIKI